MAKQKSKQFYDSYRAQRARELQDFADILKASKNIVTDLKPLTDAVTDCQRSKPMGNPNHWGYKIRGLTFKKVQDLKKIRPKSIKEVDVELSVEMTAPCIDEKCDDDCMSQLAVNIVLSDGSKKYIQAWHFDRHLGGVTETAHPIYHFQHGGDLVQGYDDNFFGSTLILEGPRIAHLPLDGILAIDFVLSNYFGEEWKKLGNNAQYRQIVEKMQLRYWRPYISSLNSVWTGATGVYSDWDPTDICPQIITATKLNPLANKSPGKLKK